jgi:hypothetical protein
MNGEEPVAAYMQYLFVIFWEVKTAQGISIAIKNQVFGRVVKSAARSFLRYPPSWI